MAAVFKNHYLMDGKLKDNREKLEETALETVQRGGLSSLSFRTLADEIGIKSSSVHYHFPEKSDLARILIERYSSEFFGKLDAISGKRWGLRRKVKAFISIFEMVSEEDKLCLCGMMASEVDQLTSDNRALLNNYFTDTETWLTQLFDHHRDELSTPLGSSVLARGLLSGLEGALLLDRATGNKLRLKAQKDLFQSYLV